MNGDRQPRSPGDYKILIVACAILFIVLGIIGIAAGFMAPPRKHELGIKAIQLGVESLLFGGFLFLVLWFIRWLLDRD